MDWIGGATEAASAGHDVVMTPESDCYLDHYQSRDHAKEPRAIGGFLPLRKVYAFEPIPAKLAAQFQEHILGAQGNLWTEYVPNLRHAEYMIFPRECGPGGSDLVARGGAQPGRFPAPPGSGRKAPGRDGCQL